MPSCTLISQSGGSFLVSGGIYSGSLWPIGGIQLKLATGAGNLIYVGLPPLSGWISGHVTSTSGGNLSSGGLLDGMEITPGDSYFVPRYRLVSGIESIRLDVPTAASGSRLFWEAL